MSRRGCYRRLLSILLPMTLALTLVGSASARTTADVAAAPAAAASAAAALAPAAADAPGHHFGFSQASVLAQTTAVGLAGLQRLTTLTVPAWTATNAPSFDIQYFDPVRGINYVAARNPGGATVGNSGPGLLAIDTATNSIIGTLAVPDCDAVNLQRGSFQCPSGAQVLPDLRKIAVTSRGNAGNNWVEIFDISGSPTAAPLLAKIVLPNNQLQPDELDYDPVNRRLYVANTGGAPNGLFLAVIDGVTNTLLGQIPMAPTGCVSTMEQPRFDPVDGFIYQNCSDDKLILRIDPNSGPFGAVVSIWSTPSSSNGIDIDPLTNQALLGSNPGPQAVVDLNAPSTLATPHPPIPVVATFPQVTATDGLYFNNNTLRWYTGSSGNTNHGTGFPCPASPINAAQFPVLGVFQGTSSAASTPSIVGVECTGNGAHTVGVDTIRNQVYVPAGAPVIGILVFKDNTASQGLTGPAFVTLGNNGTISFTPSGTGTSVQGTLTNLNGGTSVHLVVTTTVGNEVVSCSLSFAGASCQGTLLGKPLAGAPVLLVSNGAILTRGSQASGTAPPGTLTTQQAIAQAQELAGFVVGTPGRACATQVGQACTGNGNGLNVTGNVTGSMRWTVSATLPAAPPAGAGTPLFVITTTAGVEAVPCTPALAAAPAPGTVVNCTATTVGNALQGAAAVLVFPGVGGAAGPAVGPAIVTGPGPAAVVVPAAAAAVPLLPPPPPLLLPPPPSPLIPAAPSMVGGAMGRMPEVPVIPEADSLPLLLGGLAALGAIAGWRARRRR